jgi:hypothetical protein
MALETNCRHPRAMRFCGRRIFLLACLVIALVAAVTLSSAQAISGKHRGTTCTSGASSIRAEVVNGETVVSQPATSGCIP